MENNEIKGAESAETPARQIDANGVETITLKTGRVAKIAPGKGKHVRVAQRMTSGQDDDSLYLPALMSQLVTIDGKSFTMEEMDELPMSEYTELMTIFTERNFL